MYVRQSDELSLTLTVNEFVLKNKQVSVRPTLTALLKSRQNKHCSFIGWINQLSTRPVYWDYKSAASVTVLSHF